MNGRMRIGALAMLVVLVVVVLVVPAASAKGPAKGPRSLKVWVGQQLAFDTDLSEPDGQACSSCHFPTAGYADPDQDLPVSEGVITGMFGGRNAPPWAYAAFSPPFHAEVGDEGETLYVGGQFWDGRAVDLVAQAKGPFLNPVEMHNPGKWAVVRDAGDSIYAAAFERLYGKGSFKLENAERSYDNIADAIAAYESMRAVSPFTSKYDAYLAGHATLTPQEAQGLELFNGKANCDACHPSGTGETPVEGRPVFTDFTYDNLGVPTNPAYFLPPLSFNMAGYQPDLGLGVTTGDPLQKGKFKVSSLRNIALTAPYGHNGYFKTLKDIVHFYNTRDVPEAMWPAPEVPENVNEDELGNLGLTGEEEDAIVAFMETLTDKWIQPVTVP
jgi:cytochrome c peroxidase